MSQRNSEGKSSARERLREQREQDRAREKRGRVLKMSGAIVAVLAVAAGIGVAVSQTGGDDGGGGGADAKPITVGQKAAPATLTVYEDFRCPACGQFENQFRSTIHDLEKQGKLRTEYHLVTIIDDNMRGSGSRKAANAAMCAQDEGRFSQYHDVLFQNQPQEQDDAFANEKLLLKLAEKVDGLSGESFKSCVQEEKHADDVKKSGEAFAESGHQATPTILLDGKELYGADAQPITPKDLRKKVEAKS
ncbi:thioredoxin domain-containing protein [Streptomyces sp. HNM0574]|uniref:DsbA family protein n=1 Tax=Streptomyces sp. HNM0574 TaxID=2714954 RepID=UPI00146E8551|nr:thioredoxin domain-containing protein [Streptomyces sp. HNM0574]NLU67573.1 thioredoxin domain-containing protein [Streptomyces sp. HNM0574]